MTDTITSAGGIYWHGSDNSFNQFRVDEMRFALLGAGVYLYKKQNSAVNYGSHLYKVYVRGIKIAPKGFNFKEEDIVKLKERLGIDSPEVKYAGEFNPVFWCTDGWNLFGKDRKIVATMVSHVMMAAGWDGMLIDYPNGGEVCVIWRGYDRLAPEEVIVASSLYGRRQAGLKEVVDKIIHRVRDNELVSRIVKAMLDKP